MPTVSSLLATVDATYRNSYSQALKIEFMDTTQKQIFQRVPKEAQPYPITTLESVQLYSLPSDCDRFGIKAVTVETALASNRYQTLPYLSVESSETVGEGSVFYSLSEERLFINPAPNSLDAGKRVFIIYNKRPAALTDVNQVPDLEEAFQELLVLGTLERIARARGEIDDKNNFASDYNTLLADYERQYKLRQPEYYTPKDVLPRRRGQWTDNSYGLGQSVADLIPPGL